MIKEESDANSDTTTTSAVADYPSDKEFRGGGVSSDEVDLSISLNFLHGEKNEGNFETRPSRRCRRPIPTPPLNPP